MKKNSLTRRKLFKVFLILIIISGISAACQSVDSASSPARQDSPIVGSATELPDEAEMNNNGNAVPQNDQPEIDVDDPEVITAQWAASAHANSFVTGTDGKNNPCARCHAPMDWAPTMDDLPDSCFTCKFELSEPPAYIAEAEWQSIPCKVCHQVDKKEDVQPEINWLEVAALDEYTSVANSSELCLKCHAPANVPEHIAIELGGAHQDYLCSDCHNSHDLTASCGESNCHESLQDPSNIIPGHDENHSDVACEACHDGSGLAVGPNEATGTWTTFAIWAVEVGDISETGSMVFTSHNIVLEADCQRCHFAENAWGLSVEIQTP